MSPPQAVAQGTQILPTTPSSSFHLPQRRTYSQAFLRGPALPTCAGPGPTRRCPVARRAAAAEGAFGVGAVAVETARGARTAFVHICGDWGVSEGVQPRNTLDTSREQRGLGEGGCSTTDRGRAERDSLIWGPGLGGSPVGLGVWEFIPCAGILGSGEETLNWHRDQKLTIVRSQNQDQWMEFC